jgi:hypothetical protein
MNRTAAGAAVLAATLAAAAAAVAGSWKWLSPSSLPSEPDAQLRLACCVGGATFLVALCGRMAQWNAWAVTLLLATAVAVLAGHAGAAAAVVFLLLSWWTLGRAALRFLGAQAGEPSVAEAVLAGAGIVGTVISIGAGKPVHYFPVYVAALALPLWLWRGSVQQAVRGWREAVAVKERSGPAAAFVEAFSAGLLVLYVVVALLPEIGHDALAMHLFVPAQMAQRHQWGFDAATYVWAVMPMLADWLFGAAYVLGGEAAARLLNVAFLGGLAALAARLVEWCGGGRWAQRWCVLLLLSMPLTFTVASSLFIELVWTCFVLAGTLAVLRAGDAGMGARATVPAGLYLGCALAAKAVTLTILPVLLVLFAARPRAWWPHGKVRILGAAALLALVGLPPYVNAWLRTGNPVFPFFNARFRSPLYPAENFDSASSFSRGLNWDFPYDVVFHPARYIEGMAGAGGFHWLLVLVPATVALLVGRQRRALALWLAGLAMMAIAFQSVAYLRYVFPTFVLGCVAAGIALDGAGIGRVARIALATAAAAAVGLNLAFLAAASPYRDFALRGAADPERSKAWLEERQPMRNAVAVVNALNRGNAPVAVLGEPALGSLAADALIPSWYNFRFERALLSQETGSGIANLLQERGVEYVLLDDRLTRPKLRELVASVTEAVDSMGQVSVRRWKPEYRFQRELLADPEFTGAKAWQFIGDAVHAPGSALVTVQAPAWQTIAAQPGRHYLDTATIVCPDPTQARLQVNWSGARGEFLKADIRVVDCTAQPSTHTMEVVAPAGATEATVYASAHTDKRVEFRKVSFRR